MSTKGYLRRLLPTLEESVGPTLLVSGADVVDTPSENGSARLKPLGTICATWASNRQDLNLHGLCVFTLTGGPRWVEEKRKKFILLCFRRFVDEIRFPLVLEPDQSGARRDALGTVYVGNA